jgi:ATP-dependent protease ClpP protease subunit
MKTIERDTERDKWLSGDEARKYGLVDAIIQHGGVKPGEK